MLYRSNFYPLSFGGTTMYFLGKICNARIAVGGRPTGSTVVSNVHVGPNVALRGGGIAFGPGGGIGFGPGGTIAFGAPPRSEFVCTSCGYLALYGPEEIADD